MRFSGTKDFEVELMPDSSVRLTMRYATPYEAAIAYDEISSAARSGKLRMNLSLGEILEAEGPQTL